MNIYEVAFDMSKQQATWSIRHSTCRMLQVACCFDMSNVASTCCWCGRGLTQWLHFDKCKWRGKQCIQLRAQFSSHTTSTVLTFLRSTLDMAVSSRLTAKNLLSWIKATDNAEFLVVKVQLCLYRTKLSSSRELCTEIRRRLGTKTTWLDLD